MMADVAVTRAGSGLDAMTPELAAKVDRLTESRMASDLLDIGVRADRLFCKLMWIQFAAAVAAAWILTPRTWIGLESSLHIHVSGALVIGATVAGLVWLLTYTDPGRPSNALVISVAQVLMSVLLIHLCGGRIETHFHVFGSLAFLAQYRRWEALATATALVAADHALRGLFWPQSVFGVLQASSWRWLEHAAWVLFEDAVLVAMIFHSRKEMRSHAQRWAMLAVNNEVIDARVRRKTAELDAQQRQLQASEQRLRTVIDSAYDVYVGLDEQLNISDWSRRAEQLFGWPRDQVIGRPCASVLEVAELVDRVQLAFDNVNAGDGPWLLEATATSVGGKRMLVEASWSIARSALTPTANVFFRDITERRARAIRQLQAQKMEAIGGLAAGIAHEINTPSQFVGDNLCFLDQSFQQVECLLSELDAALALPEGFDQARLRQIGQKLTDKSFLRLTSEIPKAIAQSMDGMQRITSLTQAMKTFSYPSKVEMQTIDLNAVIADTIVVCRNEWKYVADVTTQFDAALPHITCQPGEINQVVMNLVVNAAHAIGEVADRLPSGKGQITVATRCNGAWVEVEVSDNGAGIPLQIRERIFEPFFTTKDVGRGTGQGLAIAHAVVEKHGGSIEVHSSPGAGSRFIIRLPLVQEDRCAVTLL